jgi:tetratricopeptide (TPR) repeat protein
MAPSRLPRGAAGARVAARRTARRALAPARTAAHAPLLALVLLLAVLLTVPLAVLFSAAPARAQSVQEGRLVLSAREVWDYAEALFREGEYFRAVSEYKRLLHYFPQDPLARPARVRIGEAYLNGGEPAQAIDQFSGLLEAPALAPLRPELLYLRGLGRLELDRAAPYGLRERHIALALEDLRAIPPAWPGNAQVPAFVQAMEHPVDVPSRSPTLAGTLSAVLPGAGSAYVGDYPEAGLALLFNTLLIGGSARSFQRGNEGLGVVLGLGALAFYGGAIYAAVNGAHRFNDRARGAYLQEQRTRFGLQLQPEGMAGVLERRF